MGQELHQDRWLIERNDIHDHPTLEVRRDRRRYVLNVNSTFGLQDATVDLSLLFDGGHCDMDFGAEGSGPDSEVAAELTHTRSDGPDAHSGSQQL